MRAIKVYLRDKNGIEDTIMTDINGTKDSINEYYLNKWFNLDCVNDHMFKVYKVKFF